MKHYRLFYLFKFSTVLLLTIFLTTTTTKQGYALTITPENMVIVNEGGFTRGIDKNNKTFSDETPAKKIYLSSFYIDKYEVSNSDYTEFIKATDYPAPAYWDHHLLNQPNQPVTGVNWFDANSYCHWVNKRLPTEAEWEKAARGPAGSIYPWGNNLEYSKANFAKGKFGQRDVTAPVDAYPEGKSYYGVYNMAGNVFEWVQDWYDQNYYKDSKNIRNPQGPNYGIKFGKAKAMSIKNLIGKKKVIRGGSWFAPAQSITTTHRFWNNPMNNSYGVGLGFRCARDMNIDKSMEARSFYIEALLQMGAEKNTKALHWINAALKSFPNNKEYLNLKTLIIKTIKP